MNSPTMTAWPTEVICRRIDPAAMSLFGREVYRLVCRTDFDQPGFCLLNLGDRLTSSAFRQAMVELGGAMSTVHREVRGEGFAFLSATRFDQQTSTKPHLDGGPAESFLLLGYEPSAVDSELSIYDYARCAYDHGLRPQEIMTKHNPMFRAGLELLAPYETRLSCFSARDYQIVCVNNSCMELTDQRSGWLGTLHTAVIPRPDESQRRVIDSMMLCPASLAGDQRLSDDAVKEFEATTVVRRRGYDKTHLQDDE